MNIPHADMLEATRLTRAGKLTEATALLQRVLRGETGPDTASAPTGEAAHAPGGRISRIIDLTPDTIELTDPQPSSRTGQASGTGVSTRPAGGTPGNGPLAHARGAAQLPRPGQRGHPEPGIGGLARRSPAHAPDVVPDGGQFLAASYGNQAGSRAYKLYIPSGYHGQAVPLVVMLHGCTQSPDDFAAGTRMNVRRRGAHLPRGLSCPGRLRQRLEVLELVQPARPAAGQGEPSLIAGITRQVMRDYAVDPERVYVAGLSAGGAAAAIMGMAYPDLYAAIGVHSGLACGAASDLPSAFAAMSQGDAARARLRGMPDNRSRPSCSTAIGTARFIRATAIRSSRSRRVLPRACRPGLQRGRVPGGHAYSRTLHADARGQTMLEQWVIHGAGHAWSGGSPAGSYTDPRGPDAAREMLRFFLEHPAQTRHRLTEMALLPRCGNIFAVPPAGPVSGRGRCGRRRANGNMLLARVGEIRHCTFLPFHFLWSA